MTPFDVAIIIGALCGLATILGGLLLLYRRIIDLAASRPENNRPHDFVIDFFGLKLSTNYAALALFAIGFGILLLTIKVSQPQSVAVQVLAQLDGDDAEDATLYVAIPLTKLEVQSDGKSIDYTVYHNLDGENLNAVICVPGNGCRIVAGKLAKTDQLLTSVPARRVDLKVVSLASNGRTKPEVNPARIEEPPVALPPVDGSGSY